MIYGKLANKILETQNAEVLTEASVYKKNGINIAPYCSPNRSYGKDAYFKVFNNTDERKATKIARIKLFETDYADKHEKGNEGKELWVLNSKERKLLNDALHSPTNTGIYKDGSKTVYETLVDEYRDTDTKFDEKNVPEEIPDYDNGLKDKKYKK